jgi:hypothetical protein
MRMFWYTKEALASLNKLGFVHFVTKDQCDPSDYEEGQAFYYDEGKREYGRVDTISKCYKYCNANLERIFNMESAAS